MPRSKLAHVVAVVAVAGVVAGCGGTSFEEEANALCAKRAETIRAELGSGAANDTERLRRLIEAGAIELASLRGLEPPAEKAETYRSLLLMLDEQLRASRDLLAAVERGDTAAAQAAAGRTGDAAARATAHGRTLGLSDCDWLT